MISTYSSASVRGVSPSKKMQAISISGTTETGRMVGADSVTGVVTAVGVGSSGILVAVAEGLES
jgi:hypothetical protein